MFSLWRKARRENSAASRLLGSTSLRFALHGWQRKYAEAYCRISSYLQTMANQGYNPLVAIQMAFSGQLYADRGE